MNTENTPRRFPGLTEEALDAFLDDGDAALLDYVRAHADTRKPLRVTDPGRFTTWPALLEKFASVRSIRRQSERTGTAIPSPAHRTCIAFDIVGFGARCQDDDVQIFVHRTLYHILEVAFERAGVGWPASLCEDRGGGTLVIVPAETAPATVLGPLVTELAVCLRQYNKLVADAAQIWLRMAVNDGPSSPTRVAWSAGAWYTCSACWRHLPSSAQ